MNIKSILKEELTKLVETKFDITHLPEDTGLFVPHAITSDIDIILYSLSEDKVYGMLSYWKEEKFSTVTSVVAEKGYGPFLYELAIMHSGGLTPARDGDITNAAWNVWEKFYKNSNVIKNNIPIYSSDYSFSLLTKKVNHTLKIHEKKELYNSFSNEEKVNLQIFNTIYKLDKSNEYNTLINNAKIAFKEKGANLRTISNLGLDKWETYYNTRN